MHYSGYKFLAILKLFRQGVGGTALNSLDVDSSIVIAFNPDPTYLSTACIHHNPGWANDAGINFVIFVEVLRGLAQVHLVGELFIFQSVDTIVGLMSSVSRHPANHYGNNSYKYGRNFDPFPRLALLRGYCCVHWRGGQNLLHRVRIVEVLPILRSIYEARGADLTFNRHGILISVLRIYGLYRDA